MTERADETEGLNNISPNRLRKGIEAFEEKLPWSVVGREAGVSPYTYYMFKSKRKDLAPKTRNRMYKNLWDMMEYLNDTYTEMGHK